MTCGLFDDIVDRSLAKLKCGKRILIGNLHLRFVRPAGFTVYDSFGYFYLKCTKKVQVLFVGGKQCDGEKYCRKISNALRRLCGIVP